MIILNKKRIIFFISVLMISFASIAFNEKNNMSKTIETSSTPVSGHIVILDAGHGKPDRRSFI